MPWGVAGRRGGASTLPWQGRPGRPSGAITQRGEGGENNSSQTPEQHVKYLTQNRFECSPQKHAHPMSKIDLEAPYLRVQACSSLPSLLVDCSGGGEEGLIGREGMTSIYY